MNTPRTPEQAWRDLVEGNSRYAAGASRHDHQDPERRLELADHQDPFGLVLGCSDSRVPAEVVFDQGLGDLFVVRTAGHIVDSAVLGSIEFGVEVLQVPLILVLGHTGCGAVAATVRAIDAHHTPSGYLRDVVERVSPAVFEARRVTDTGPDAIAAENVRQTTRALLEKSATLADAVRSGRTAVVGALYRITEGVVSPVLVRGELEL